MAYKIKINNDVFPIRDGFTIKDEYNETLDSSIVEFNIYSGELNKVPFDKCVIFDDQNKIQEKHLLVDNYDDTTIEFGQTPEQDKHKYTLTSFSQTKELERITMPNRTTTQSIIQGDTKKSVWFYIYHFCQEYLPKIRVYDPDNQTLKWVNKYRIDRAVMEKFDSIDCPEFQWNNPTLREVLNDLMSTADCIVVVREDVISYYDLKLRGQEINRSNLTLMKKTMTSGDYISELSVYMQNAIGKNVTTVMPFQTVRTAEQSGRITTENCAIVTQSPIYSVKKLTLYFFEQGNGKVHKLLETDRVLEYDEWQLQSSIKVGATTGYYDLPYFQDSNGYNVPKHKLNFLYYKRGSNTIENLGKAYEATTGSQNFATNILRGTAVQLGTAQMETKWYGSGNTIIDPRFLLYELEYETMSQHAMNVGKYLPSEHPENRIFDSQDNSYVDVEHQSIFEYAKVNRLGNKIVEIYGEYKNENDIPKLGDYLDRNVLFSREITYYDDIIYFKGLMTENYILRDYFTSVRAKKRSWQIASDKDALTSHNIIKYYVETSFYHKEEIVDDIDSTIQAHQSQGGLIHDLTNIYHIQDYPRLKGKTVSFLMIQTRSYESTPPTFTPVVLDCNKEIQGNSLCYNFGFTDNYKSSDYAESVDAQSFYEYANEKGEYSSFSVYLSYTIKNDFPVSIPTPAEEGGTGTLTTEDKNNIFDVARKQPKVSLPSTALQADTYGTTKFFYSKHKDNREIERYSMQFEYCSDTPEIIITPKYIEYVRQVNADLNKTFQVFISTTEQYGLTTTEPLGERWIYFENSISFTKQNGYSMKMFIKGATTVSGLASIGIADSNGNLLIGINKTSQNSSNFNTIYFNLLKSRDDKVYFSNEDNYVIGRISDSIGTIANNYNRHQSEIQNSSPRSIRILRRNITDNDTIDIDYE